MQKQNWMRDYSKRKTAFVKDYERAQRLAFHDMCAAITPKGWFSRILHAIAGKPFFGKWN